MSGRIPQLPPLALEPGFPANTKCRRPLPRPRSFIFFGRSPVLLSVRGVGTRGPLRNELRDGAGPGLLPLLFVPEGPRRWTTSHDTGDASYNRLDLGASLRIVRFVEYPIGAHGLGWKYPKTDDPDETLPLSDCGGIRRARQAPDLGTGRTMRPNWDEPLPSRLPAAFYLLPGDRERASSAQPHPLLTRSSPAQFPENSVGD